MRHPAYSLLRAALAAGVLLAATASAQDQTSDRDVPPAAARKQAAEIAHGDPARWYREDRTTAAHLRTLQKEIGAAQAEQLAACRSLPAGERGPCVKDARATYRQDMAAARGNPVAARD
ncbi:MAG TPA: hypothetical protein VFG03_10990 [Telluria sp.]|nr:hypothetical protein [Telluria sp.]